MKRFKIICLVIFFLLVIALGCRFPLFINVISVAITVAVFIGVAMVVMAWLVANDDEEE